MRGPRGVAYHISRSALGLAMSAFYAATALGSPVAKRLAARLPVPAVLAFAALVASAVMLVTSRATGFATLTTVLVAGGLSNGLVQPAAGSADLGTRPGAPALAPLTGTRTDRTSFSSAPIPGLPPR